MRFLRGVNFFLVTNVRKFSDFVEQIRLTQVCTYFHNTLKIYDFSATYNPILTKLTDEILKRYPYIKYLNIPNNYLLMSLK